MWVWKGHKTNCQLHAVIEPHTPKAALYTTVMHDMDSPRTAIRWMAIHITCQGSQHEHSSPKVELHKTDE